nr:restriction endonuclease [Delftia acidovorans]
MALYVPQTSDTNSYSTGDKDSRRTALSHPMAPVPCATHGNEHDQSIASNDKARNFVEQAYTTCYAINSTLHTFIANQKTSSVSISLDFTAPIGTGIRLTHKCCKMFGNLSDGGAGVARKRKTSTAEDLMDLITMLPWWAGIALALTSYMVLHSIAIRPLPAAQNPQQIGQLATTAIWQGLANGGQYILPLICLAGAAISAVRKRRRSRLFETTSASSSADALQNMSWREFETLVGEGFRRRGYSVKETGGGGPDGGVDLVLSKDGEKTLVQFKQWKAFKVGVSKAKAHYEFRSPRSAARVQFSYAQQALSKSFWINSRFSHSNSVPSYRQHPAKTIPSRMQATLGLECWLY